MGRLFKFARLYDLLAETKRHALWHTAEPRTCICGFNTRRTRALNIPRKAETKASASGYDRPRRRRKVLFERANAQKDIENGRRDQTRASVYKSGNFERRQVGQDTRALPQGLRAGRDRPHGTLRRGRQHRAENFNQQIHNVRRRENVKDNAS